MRTGWLLHTGLLPDRIRLAKIWHDQPELNRIRAGFAQYYPGCLWKNGTECKSRELVAGWLRSCQKWTGPNDSCTLACFQTRCVWPDPDQAIQIGSGSVLHNIVDAFFEKNTELKRMRESGSGKYCPARFWLHSGCNGHNWPYPKRFRIGSGMFSGQCLVFGWYPVCHCIELTWAPCRRLSRNNPPSRSGTPSLLSGWLRFLHVRLHNCHSELKENWTELNWTEPTKRALSIRMRVAR